jgi:hypothetical protein
MLVLDSLFERPSALIPSLSPIDRARIRAVSFLSRPVKDQK